MLFRLPPLLCVFISLSSFSLLSSWKLRQRAEQGLVLLVHFVEGISRYEPDSRSSIYDKWLLLTYDWFRSIHCHKSDLYWKKYPLNSSVCFLFSLILFSLTPLFFSELLCCTVSLSSMIVRRWNRIEDPYRFCVIDILYVHYAVYSLYSIGTVLLYTVHTCTSMYNIM